MNDRPTPATPASGNGPWRLLVLDRDPNDPVWLIASIVPANVRPAIMLDTRYRDWAAVVEWAERQCGHATELVPLQQPLVWRIDRQRRSA